MTVLVMAGILIFGLAAYRLLPVSTLPSVDFPTIQVSASLPGASPETMASAVATPLEKQFSTIAGIDQMTSISGQGITQITIQFNLGRDIDAAAQDVNSAIASAARQRRGPGAGFRAAEVRGARAGRPERARRARHRHQRGRAGDRQRQRQPADWHALRP
jgi:hypothetical protein